VRGRVEAESKYDSWYQSETMKGLGRKRGKMDLAQTQAQKYNLKKEKE
jgi:hypothetical protein